tara:strand:- start:265 stop:492 length:228 start_codon:yes stop_codon:yes gene_type:complete
MTAVYFYLTISFICNINDPNISAQTIIINCLYLSAGFAFYTTPFKEWHKLEQKNERYDNTDTTEKDFVFTSVIYL